MYEMVGDAAEPAAPRAPAESVLPRRATTVRRSAIPCLDQRATWAVGWYNDWSVAGRSPGPTRATTSRGAHYGAAGVVERMAPLPARGRQRALLRRGGQPARATAASRRSNVADDFVDTGKVAGRSRLAHRASRHSGTVGGSRCLPSTVAMQTSAPATTAIPRDRWLVCRCAVGWITGEHRPYDRKAGYARRVLPQGRWGARQSMVHRGAAATSISTTAHDPRRHRWIGREAGVNRWAVRPLEAGCSVTAISSTFDRFHRAGNQA